MIDATCEKPIVKCDGCGEIIDACGWLGYGIDEHYCDDCYANGKAEGRADEFRICDRCGRVMTEGFCNESIDHICESCFESWMNEICPNGWRANDHEDVRLWDGGYYDEFIDGEWVDTGIYWTEWY